MTNHDHELYVVHSLLIASFNLTLSDSHYFHSLLYHPFAAFCIHGTVVSTFGGAPMCVQVVYYLPILIANVIYYTVRRSQ
jgi:hypothetical protein